MYLERIHFLDKNYPDKKYGGYWNKELKNGFRRWEYFSKVIDELHKIPNEKVLEIGVYRMPLTTHSDIMDLTGCDIAKNMYLRDAGIPEAWLVFEDKQYDCVIANQVWEHLNGNQAKAWEQVARVSNYALITIPWKWNCPTNKTHHNIGEKEEEEWFGAYGELYHKEYINERMLLCYQF